MPSGCCGVAGVYGQEKANRAPSEKIYRLSWANYLADALFAGRMVATGYSCRTQAKIVDGAHLLHPVQLLLARLAGNRRRATPNAGVPQSAHGEHHEDY